MRLDTHLKGLGLTDQAFASMIGCERSFVTKLRHGDAHASYAVLQRIEEATAGRVTAADIYETRKSRLASNLATKPSRKLRRKTRLSSAAE